MCVAVDVHDVTNRLTNKHVRVSVTNAVMTIHNPQTDKCKRHDLFWVGMPLGGMWKCEVSKYTTESGNRNSFDRAPQHRYAGGRTFTWKRQWQCINEQSTSTVSERALTKHRPPLAHIAVCCQPFRFQYDMCDSNKSPTRCNNFSIYYPDVYLQLNMFRAFSRPSTGAQWLQWQPLVLPSYRSDSRAVLVVGPTGPTTSTARLSPNKSPTRCNNCSVYYPDVYLQLNMFRAFSRPKHVEL